MGEKAKMREHWANEAEGKLSLARQDKELLDGLRTLPFPQSKDGAGVSLDAGATCSSSSLDKCIDLP